MKLHLGCGTVYLRGWVNMDLPGPHVYLASERPDLVARWETTEDQYFARHADKTLESLAAGPLDQQLVCDVHGSLFQIPVASWSVEEVLLRHVFEHLSLTEAHVALDQIDGALINGGILRIDVPDHEETLRLLRETGEKFYERHLLGPRRNNFGFHMMSYSRDRLRALVESHGFVWIAEEPNIHLYPSFTLKLRKKANVPPCEYAPVELQPGETMIDIGPGGFEHPRADMYLDRDEANAARLRSLGKTVITGDIESGMPEIPDKAYDFIWSSHMFEHLERPLAAAATLSRIGKRGRLIMPSAAKEALTNWEEATHLWHVLEHPQSGRGPIFIRNNPKQLDALRDRGVMGILSRIYRTGPNYRVTEEGRDLRAWWNRCEPKLDVIYDWNNAIDITVIE